jgi:cysteine desulfuration protein SufE
MTFSDKQNLLLEQLAALPTVEERLMWLSGLAKSGHAWHLPEAERLPEQLVTGCVSQVWLQVHSSHGLLKIRAAADSAMVAGLVLAHARLADGLPASEVREAYFDWPSRSGLDRQLSPTRLRGLAAVAQALRERAV